MFATEGHPYGAASALVALVSGANEAGLGQGVDDAVAAGRLDVVHGAGQCGGGPQQAAERVGEDLHIHAVLAVLARVEGPVGGDPVNGQQGAVQDHERLGCRALEGLLKRGDQRGQEVHGLADVAVDRGHTYAEGGREPGVGVTAAQVGQDEQGLPIGGGAASGCRPVGGARRASPSRSASVSWTGRSRTGRQARRRSCSSE